MEHRDLPPLPLDKQKSLRSGVAKLLYLSINTRPDIALPVNYLCTRVERFDVMISRSSFECSTISMEHQLLGLPSDATNPLQVSTSTLMLRMGLDQ
jgi:hypothetical protein